MVQDCNRWSYELTRHVHSKPPARKPILHVFVRILKQLAQGVELLLLREVLRPLLYRGSGISVVLLRTTETEVIGALLANAECQGIVAASVRRSSAKVATGSSNRSRKGCLRCVGGLQALCAEVSCLLDSINEAADMAR